LDQAKYFGHLELYNIFIRALKRAAIPVKYTEGFHPKPKLSFEDPLPMGLESRNENFYVDLPVDFVTDRIVEKLNRQLPEGLDITGCRPAKTHNRNKGNRRTTYTASLKEGRFEKKELDDFYLQDRCVLEKVNRKGNKKSIDLKKVVLKLELISPQLLQLELRDMPAQSVRPNEVIQKIFSLTEDQIKMARIIKVLSYENGRDPI
jgi:radical SAM-linked protein